MRAVSALVAVGVLLAGGYYFFFVRDANKVPVEAPPTESLNLQSFEGMGVSFAYPNDWVLVESDSAGEMPADGAMVMLYPEDEWEALQDSAEPREGPPGISVAVYAAESAQGAQEWVHADARSNYQLMGTAQGVREIDGRAGYAYRSSGLYERSNVAVLENGYLYLFSADSINDTDPLMDAFETVLAHTAFMADAEDEEMTGGIQVQ